MDPYIRSDEPYSVQAHVFHLCLSIQKKTLEEEARTMDDR